MKPDIIMAWGWRPPVEADAEEAVVEDSLVAPQALVRLPWGWKVLVSPIQTLFELFLGSILRDDS